MAFVVGAIVAGSIAVIGGTVKAIDGANKAKAASAAAKQSAIELKKQKSMFSNLDTSNPYLNMENKFEDATVNTQEAEFVKQQQMQQQANVMQGLRGAAGGSGIAALAQTMANQGSLNAQKAGASIGKQEQANQQAKLAEDSRLAGLEREGEMQSRSMEMGKVTSLMGMSADELATQRQMKMIADAQKMEGIQEGIAGVGQVGMGVAGGAMNKDLAGSGTDMLGNYYGQKQD